VSVVVDVKITSADGDGLHFDQDIIVFQGGFRHVSNLDQPFAFPIFHDSFHSLPLNKMILFPPMVAYPQRKRRGGVCSASKKRVEDFSYPSSGQSPA